jgi:hypothetical protein
MEFFSYTAQYKKNSRKAFELVNLFSIRPVPIGNQNAKRKIDRLSPEIEKGILKP